MMTDISRRNFLLAGGGATAAVLLAPVIKIVDDLAWAIAPYPSQKICNIEQLIMGKAFAASYPDKDSPIMVLNISVEALGGVGPGKSIVAFSSLCTHKGCPLIYLPKDETFVCPCHHSKFDPAKAGQIVIAQATENLPQIELEIDSKGDIYATGVKTLLYGRFQNLSFKAAQ